MVSIPKIFGIMSCCVICLSLANAAQADDNAPNPSANMISDSCYEKPTGQVQREYQTGELQQSNMNCYRTMEGAETVKGELRRISGDNYVVQRFTGQEVRLHTDSYTQMSTGLRVGDRIEAKVDDARDKDDQKRVLSIHRIQ